VLQKSNMALNIKTIRQAINPAYLKQPPTREEIELFKKEFIVLFDHIDISESEEFNKNLIKEFLNSVYYKNKHYINTKGRNDLVIHNDNNADSPVSVLIETKSPTNTTEMIRTTDLNKKSFQELVLYYLRERKTGRNFELRYLIINNIYEWFVFDARNFEDTFGSDTELVKRFSEFENKTSAATKTDTFYREIAAPAIERHIDKIEFAHFDIRNYEKIIRNAASKDDDRQLIALYKFLSPVHLLKLPFANDNNQLNREFYAELLHIIGLEEITQDGRKLIVRKKEDERHSGSIIENAMERIVAKNKLVKTDNYPSLHFDIALDLAITWINRILFLKLLESQILKYHNGNRDYAFLSPRKEGQLSVSTYNDLDTLFFSVLARKENERPENIRQKYAHVPYLNSSLFEITEMEDKTICIDSLQDNIKMLLYAKSVLTASPNPSKGGEFPPFGGIKGGLRPLEYLLRFLDAYDFSSEGSEDIQEENKPLVSASVLGLIFEKINGYKDGSFFTPSFITMYMCRETIGRAVVQKFNDAKGWNCQTIGEVYNKIDDIVEANAIFNAIRICDPAVGSGHFLVSALNEMIYLKSELGILTDKNGKRLKNYRVTVENDELIITDDEGNYFVYNPQSAESQRVQETFFREKQTIIENCLFGVDINPNSVKICQLRLWIELLKHAYYYNVETDNYPSLQTLPNIDINIKCGNSLMNRFDLADTYRDISALEHRIKQATKKYREWVSLYKTTHNKEAKRQIVKNIENEKSIFYQINNARDPDYQNLRKVRDELALHTQDFNFFETQTDEWSAKTAELTDKVQKLEAAYNEKIRGCFEWRFEFPEVLDDNGNFTGFDVVIGNPPYIQLQSMGSVADAYKKMNYQVFERTGDIYCLFYERGYQLLKPQGRLCYITSNKWMRADYGEKIRKFFIENSNPELLIDFSGVKVFDEATVDVNVLMFQKDKNRQQTQSCIVKTENIKNLSVFISQNCTNCNFNAESWVILSSTEQRIKAKIETVGIPLKDWDINIYRGILTGFNEAFIISGEKRKELIEQDPKSEEIIRPVLRGRDIKKYGYDFADLWLLFIPWHFPLHTDRTIQGASEKAEQAFLEQYPAIYNHLLKYKKELLNRNKAETGIRYEWYALQRWGANYWEDFNKQKIVWGNLNLTAAFSFAPEGMFINAPCPLIVPASNYLLAILNSKLADYYIRSLGVTRNGGYFEYKPMFVEKLPVPMIEESQQQPFIALVNQLLSAKKENPAADTAELEREIDGLVYGLYGLTEEEVGIVEK